MDNFTQNTKAIAKYIKDGESNKNKSGLLGFELEHFVVDAKTNAMVPYMCSDAYTRPSVEDVLSELARFYDDAVYVKDSEGKSHLVGLVRPSAPLSIEPGAQIEVSIGPCKYIWQIEDHYNRFRKEIVPILQKMGYKLVNSGYHPTECAANIPLIPKQRYIMMDKYFKNTGKHGICMMRGSASTQISIDYNNEADAIAKMQVATALGPLLYFVFDNAPVFEANKVGVVAANEGGCSDSEVSCGDDVNGANAIDDANNGNHSIYSTPYRMVRSAIWNDVDSARSMTADFLFEDDPSYFAYAKMLMQSPPILTLSLPNDDSSAIYHGSKPLYDIYTDKIMSTSEIEHVLSMFFFDVRLKQYIEIRQPDSMPFEYGLAFAALIKGIFYGSSKSKNAKVLDILHKEFKQAGVFAKDGAKIIAQAKASLMDCGYDATIYGRRAKDWLNTLVELAREGLESLKTSEGNCSGSGVPNSYKPLTDKTSSSSPSSNSNELLYLEPLATLVSKQTTLVEQTLKEQTQTNLC